MPDVESVAVLASPALPMVVAGVVVSADVEAVPVVSVGVAAVPVVSAVMSPVPVVAASVAGALLSVAAVPLAAVSAVLFASWPLLQPAVSEAASTSALARTVMVGAFDFIGVSWWLA
ncbi:MAG: hypothetical protein ACJ8GK_02530 [Luteimonas sp.]